MPLFFLIAAGLGAFTVGATAVDTTGVAKKNEQARAAQSAPVQQQAYTVDTSASPPVVTYQPTDK